MQTSYQAIAAFDTGDQPAVDVRRDDGIDLIDVAAACAIVGGSRPVHRSTLWRLVKAGKLPAPNKQLRRWNRRPFVQAVKAMMDEEAS